MALANFTGPRESYIEENMRKTWGMEKEKCYGVYKKDLEGLGHTACATAMESWFKLNPRQTSKIRPIISTF
jgi:uncharacterized membrane protein